MCVCVCVCACVCACVCVCVCVCACVCVCMHVHTSVHSCTTLKLEQIFTFFTIPLLYSHKCSAAFEADSGRKIFQDEIFEYHFRVPFTSFERAKVSWRDVVRATVQECLYSTGVFVQYECLYIIPVFVHYTSVCTVQECLYIIPVFVHYTSVCTVQECLYSAPVFVQYTVVCTVHVCYVVVHMYNVKVLIKLYLILGLHMCSLLHIQTCSIGTITV